MPTNLTWDIILIIIVAAYALFILKRLIFLRNSFKQGFVQIDLQLRRRYSLIPTLLKAVAPHFESQKDLILTVAQACDHAKQIEHIAAIAPHHSKPMKLLLSAEGKLSTSLAKLIDMIKKNRELGKNDGVTNLLEELAVTESRIGFSKQTFNEAVRKYNKIRNIFPNFIFAWPLGFRKAKLFYMLDSHSTSTTGH